MDEKIADILLLDEEQGTILGVKSFCNGVASFFGF